MGWRAGAGAGFAGLRRAGRHTGGSTVLPYWGQYGWLRRWRGSPRYTGASMGHSCAPAQEPAGGARLRYRRSAGLGGVCCRAPPAVLVLAWSSRSWGCGCGSGVTVATCALLTCTVPSPAASLNQYLEASARTPSTAPAVARILALRPVCSREKPCVGAPPEPPARPPGAPEALSRGALRAGTLGAPTPPPASGITRSSGLEGESSKPQHGRPSLRTRWNGTLETPGVSQPLRTPTA
jgi:hypothetical protein